MKPGLRESDSLSHEIFVAAGQRWCWRDVLAMVEYSGTLQPFLDEIGQYLPRGGRILDFGCGFGLFSLYFALRSPTCDLQLQLRPYVLQRIFTRNCVARVPSSTPLRR